MLSSTKLVRIGCLLVFLTACTGPKPVPTDTLDAVRTRGSLLCGVANNNVPGFIEKKENSYSGLDADICRAVAVAVLGNAEAVEFLALSEQDSLNALLDGDLDLLSRATMRSGVDAGLALNFAPLTFHTPESHQGPVVREGDEKWFAVISWTIFATFAAEEFGVSSRNVATWLTSKDDKILYLLGVEPEVIERLGLERRAFYNVIEQVGNYAEIYKRNFGAEPRGLNASYKDGGLLYAPPFR